MLYYIHKTFLFRRLGSLVPRPPPFFVLWFVYYTEHKPKNKKWGRPGNEARVLLKVYCVLFSFLSSLLLWSHSIRLAVCSEHTEEQLSRAADIIRAAATKYLA